MRKRKLSLLFIPAIISAVLVSGFPVSAAPQNTGTGVEAEIFSGHDVALNEGIFKESQEIGEEYLLTYDVDRLAVSLFRYSDKKDDAPVDMNNGYGGWEDSGENGIGGHIYGHYMSACVAMYMQTGNEQLKNNGRFSRCLE